MKTNIIAAVFSITVLSAGCQTAPEQVEELTVNEYCADQVNTNDHVCQVKWELDGHSELLANTSMGLTQARAIADAAQQRADEARARAEEAARKAEEARRLAQRALLTREDLVCKTQIIQKTKVGACEAGYMLMSCSQTRFTHNSGGVSIMREINDRECRFQDRVLEMQVRCCRLATGTEKAANATSVEAARYSVSGLYE